MTLIHSYNIDEISTAIERFELLLRKNEEQTLAEIIAEYDFIVGSEECKHKLMDVLPEEANIIYSPYVGSPTTIYAIKKFDAIDYTVRLQEERGNRRWGS